MTSRGAKAPTGVSGGVLSFRLVVPCNPFDFFLAVKLLMSSDLLLFARRVRPPDRTDIHEALETNREKHCGFKECILTKEKMDMIDVPQKSNNGLRGTGGCR